MRKNLFVAILMVIGMAISVFAGEEKTIQKFIRYKTGSDSDSGLQISVTEYTSSVKSSSIVTLYGVVHIADGSYYKKVQEDLDTFDVVLYEGVGGDKSKMVEQKKSPSVLSTIQHLTGDVLDLQFQLDSIDYTRKNLVHADVSSMDDLKEKMKGEEISPLGQYIKEDQLSFIKPLLDMAGPLLKQLLKIQPNLQNDLKSQLGQQIANADINAQLSPDMYQAIVIDRNKIVIEKLTEQLKNPTVFKEGSCMDYPKKIAVFYGAAHMVDLQNRLLEMGFKQSMKRWMTAWHITQTELEKDSTLTTPTPERHRQRRQDDRQRKVEEEDK